MPCISCCLRNSWFVQALKIWNLQYAIGMTMLMEYIVFKEIVDLSLICNTGNSFTETASRFIQRKTAQTQVIRAIEVASQLLVMEKTDFQFECITYSQCNFITGLLDLIKPESFSYFSQNFEQEQNNFLQVTGNYTDSVVSTKGTKLQLVPPRKYSGRLINHRITV